MHTIHVLVIHRIFYVIIMYFIERCMIMIILYEIPYQFLFPYWEYEKRLMLSLNIIELYEVRFIDK